MKFQQCDVLVIGAGVIGLATGITILENNLRLKVVIAEKKEGLAKHAYGRNTGVNHVSFYYLPGPFKAQFCRDRDSVIRMLAKRKGILVRNMRKVVMARNHEENISFTCSN